MTKEYKDENSKDIMSLYFNDPVWQMKSGDPVPDMPLDVQLELINRCNLGCEDCPSVHQRRSKSLLEWDVLRQIVDESAEEGVGYLTICGVGEAALHPDLFRLCGYIRGKKVARKGLRALEMMPTILISNAMWTSEQVAECIENPPDVLSVSLAGLTDGEIKRRRSPIDLERFWTNVHRIYSQRRVVSAANGALLPIIHVATHIYPFEIEEREEDIAAFKKKWFEISDAVITKVTMLCGHNRQKFLGESTGTEHIAQLHYTNISATHFERSAPCFETSRRLSIDSDGDVWCGHRLGEQFCSFL